MSHIGQGDGRPAEGAHDPDFVGDRPCRGGSNTVGGRGANGKSNRHAFSPFDELRIHGAQIAGRNQIDPSFVAAAQHQAAIADIAFGPIKIATDIDAGGNIRGAIFVVLKMNRKARKIRICAGQHDVMHWRFRTRYFDRRDGRGRAFQELRKKFLFCDAKGQGQAPPAAHDIADEFGLFCAGLPDQNRLGIAVKTGGDINEIDRLVDCLEFALPSEQVDETA